jgi:hypothetical protein
MDLSKIKSKLASLQRNSNQTRSRRSDYIWKPSIGKSQIRIIPAMWNREDPFKEVYFHYDIATRPMISLINFGEKDPIVEFAENLKKQSYTPENFKMAKKLEPKLRVFAPVVVRGEEDKGVRLWEFGREVYMELLAIAEDEDIGDYTDTYQGRDIIVETVGPEQSGRTFSKSSVRIKAKTTPASDNSNLIKQWLDNQPDPLTIQDKPTYEDLKQALYEYLNPAEDEDGDEALPAPTAQAQTPPAKQPGKYGLETKEKKSPDIEKELNSIFEDDNDLPF